jgi:hypothetical protein
MSLPEQVRKQSESIQQMYEQLKADTEEQVVESEELQESDAREEAEEPAQQENEETTTQKYRTLQGMYNAEVPRLHQQNRELQQRLASMEQLMATMSSQPTKPATKEALVTQQDIDDYGDSIEMMRKVAREEFGAYLGKINTIEKSITQVVPQVQTIAQQQRLSAEQQFWADLASTVPNFRQINDNKQFQKWLLEVDPLTGIKRQTYLEDAQRSLDARRVASFFITWLSQNPQKSNKSTNSQRSQLETQIAPGRSRSSSGNNVNEPRTYTPKDISTFFADVRMGKYKGKEQERDRIERDIFAAQKDGRIVMNG